MRIFICQIMMLSMLFMSMEGVADMMGDALSHDSTIVHQASSAKSFSSDADIDLNLDLNQYGHLCHGHAASITASLATALPMVVTTDHQSVNTPQVQNDAQAPPTPPPNA